MQVTESRFSPHSDQEDAATAAARGKVLHNKIYGRNPSFNPQATVDASPDYAFVIRSMSQKHHICIGGGLF
jgi:hypothetical protein